MEETRDVMDLIDEFRKNGDYEKEYELLLEEAMNGNTKAMVRLANMYFYNQYVQRDFLKAYKYYNMAAQLGDFDAMFRATNLYFMYPDIIPSDNVVKYLLELVDNENASACISLGDLYERGVLVEQSALKAIELYEKAIEYGDTFGYELIGDIYFKGEYVEQDYKKAFEYYTKNPSRNLDTDIRIGKMYEKGLGVTQDIRKAIEYYRSAVETYENDVERLDPELYPVDHEHYEEVREHIKALERGQCE